MPKPTTDSVLASLVDVGLAAPWHALKFEPTLERRYNEDTAHARIRHITITGIIGGLLVMMFQISDYTLIRDVFLQAVFLRGIFNPVFVVFALFWVHRTRSAAVREIILVTFGILTELVIVYLALKTHSPYRSEYLTGTFLIILYVNVVGQARFGYAVAATICSLATVLCTLIIMSDIPLPVGLSVVVVNLGTGTLTLVANFQLEHQSRRNYLMKMRDQLRNDDLTHNNLELQTLSEEDPLTGVYNRRALDRRIDELFDRSKRHQNAISVIMIDVDHFKSYNDNFGHPAGDRCLQRIAAILIDETRDRRDLVARYGGEEFIIVMPHSGLADVLSTAERIRAAIEACAIPAATRDPSSPRIVTASFGVASCDHTAGRDTAKCPCTPAALIHRADQALYNAKKTGRNRVH